MLNSLQNGRCSFIITKLLVHTTTLLISAKNSFLFFTSLFLHTTIPSVTIKIPQKRRDQGAREYCEDWHSSNLSLLPQNMDSDNRAHNYWFLSLRLRKIGVLQVSSLWWRFLKSECQTIQSTFSQKSKYCYYFHTVLMSSQNLTFP